jgi:ribosomal protein L29
MQTVIGSAATNAQQAANFPLVQHANRSTPTSETLLNVDNVPGSLASMAIKRYGVAQFRQLSTTMGLPQRPFQELREQSIQELNCGINGLQEKLQAAMKQNLMDHADQSHFIARTKLNLCSTPPSRPSLSWETLNLPSSEAYRPLLDRFEKFEQQFGGEAYAGSGGQSPAMQQGTLVRHVRPCPGKA